MKSGFVDVGIKACASSKKDGNLGTYHPNRKSRAESAFVSSC